MTKSTTSAFTRVCAAGALALGLGLTTAASAQDTATAPTNPLTTEQTVDAYAPGTCHPSADLATHLREAGQTPAVYGLTHTRVPGFMLTIQGGVHLLPGRDENNSAWTIMSVNADHTACIVMKGDSSEQQFGLADAIEAGLQAPAAPDAALIIPAAFSPLPVPMRVCHAYAAADRTIEESFALVRVFTGAMADGRSVVVYGPDHHKMQENGNRFMVTLENKTDNVSCPIVLGIGYQAAQPR